MVDLTILIPTRASREQCLYAVLTQLKHQTYKDFEVWLLYDKEPFRRDLTRKYFPFVTKIVSQDQKPAIYYCRLLNWAINQVATPYILKLDDDTLDFPPNAIEKLIEEMSSAERIGAVGPTILIPNNRYNKVDPTPEESLTSRWHVNKFDLEDEVHMVDQEQVQHTLYKLEHDYYHAGRLAGDFVLFKTEAIKRVPYDEEFFKPLMCDDIQVSLGLRAHGWCLRWVPSVVTVTYQHPDKRVRSTNPKDVARVFHRLQELYGGRYLAW